VIRVLLQFASTVLVFLLLANNLRGFYLSGWGAATMAALVLGLVNSTLGFVLRVLSFPLILLTLGLFYFVVNAFIIILVAFVVPGFSIHGFWPALVAAVVLSALGMFWKVAGRRPAEED
jgi:putative membrane protein